MAVQVYKDGKLELIRSRSIADYLRHGWSLDDPAGIKRPEKRVIVPPHLSKLTPEAQERQILRDMGITVPGAS